MTGIMMSVLNNVRLASAASIPAPLLYLDAEDYAGSGTTWTAAAGSDATLVNTPTFAAPSPTYFSFAPASLEEATLPALSNLNNWTIEAWFRVTSTLTGQVTAVICDQYNLINALNFSMGTNNAPFDYKIRIGFFNGAWRNTSGFTPTLNTWYHVVGTYDGTTMKEYVDGAPTSSASSLGTSSSGGVGVRVARRWDETATSTNYFPGDIGLTRVWDSALSAAQVQELYNEHAARFGLAPTVTAFTTAETTTWTAPAGVSRVQYLVVAGGAGGGNGYDSGGGGGGGGGMVLTGNATVVPGETYTVTVGAGGTGGADTRTNNNGTAGENSVFGSVTALGGGFGQGSRTATPTARYTGGAAQIATVTPPQGGGGGGGGGSGGGGGGATGAGTNGSGTTAGTGGTGTTSSITGSSVTYGAGGNGGNYNVNNNDGAAGGANTGKGGGAGSSTSSNSGGGGNGGSGIVVLRYGQ